ncbi:MAG: carbohydrate ABC transporter permease [Deltaproteobacteria bacterium]|uniref:Carbohydrate ABC transporter permease n=1 Tax=Candidatus Desulfacyla euxinica TaxID=2841693 RepID=A0A8J6TA19_9DELT|nr:carbohydrate ABC transporter permease [Candidatus Desulfacyla euxinica]MBL7216329.1 carbohydrate ABC transporter permease [Desulfobacteraceae bacterium]
MSREQIEHTIIRVLRIVGILFFVLMVAFPFYWMIASSLRPLEEILMNPANLGLDFRKIDLSAYYNVLFDHGFVRYILNSLYVSIITVALSVALATVGGYAVTRLRFRGQSFMSYSILIIYMFPAIVLVIPLYVIFSHMGLRDSVNVLILVYLAQTLPVALYMLRSYFKTLPLEIENAGLIDGCTRFGVIWRIIIPLSAPALASVGLYTFMIAWNEFLFAFMFLDTPDKFTLSRGVVQLAGSVHLSKQLVMAASVLVTLPILFLFLFFERYLARGMTSGAMKG